MIKAGDENWSSATDREDGGEGDPTEGKIDSLAGGGGILGNLGDESALPLSSIIQ